MAHDRRRAGHGARIRVLFTGNGVRMIDNLVKHISSPFESQTCPANEDAFTRSLIQHQPHIIIICLQDEYPKDLETYYVLEDDSRYTNLPVLVIGRDEDCALFRKKITIDKAVIMGRPLNMDLFLPTLEKMADDAMAAEGEDDEPEEDDNQPQKEASDASKGTAGSNEKDNGRKSILVVDDDVRMLNTIKLYLDDMYDVTIVPSGKLALKFLSKKHADLVLLDYLMPEMDGPQVLEKIRTTCPHPEVPVLFLTGVNDKDMVMKTLDFNPSGYLLKPATRELLLERVTEILLGL